MELMEDGPEDSWQGMPFADAIHLNRLFAEQGLDIISDTRIIDMRNTATHSESPHILDNGHVYVYRLVSVRKITHAQGSTGLKLQSDWDMPDLTLRCHNVELNPQLLRSKVESSDESPDRFAWQIKLDFSQVPVGHTTDVIVEAMLPCVSATGARSDREWLRFEVDADPEVATSWILLPELWRNSSPRLVRYENSHPDQQEIVEPTHRVTICDGSVLNWTVVHPKAGFTYTCRWMRDR